MAVERNQAVTENADLLNADQDQESAMSDWANQNFVWAYIDPTTVVW